MLPVLFFAAAATFSVLAPADVRADELAARFAQTLSAKDRKKFQAYHKAWTAHRASLDAFWAKVQAKRDSRRKKRRAGLPIKPADYVKGFPPEYKGERLGGRLAGKWTRFQTKDRKRVGPKKKKGLPGLKSYLAAAKRHYNFKPMRIEEREFKRRYAREALRLGLSKDQVVRVYALETGGNGTADMQAGIHPITKKGRPISSALGYAQLLAANSISELVVHGPKFIKRLAAMAAGADVPKKRIAALNKKISVLRAMLSSARSVPNKWSHHVRYSRTSRGMGIHALNLDGDIGPWLQVNKLNGIMKIAKNTGRTNLKSAELELMNLAGPGTGLEMMTTVGRSASTVNFFARRGYERNTIVRGKSALELLGALEERMNVNVQNKGAIEFNKIFDELLQEK